MVGKEAGQGVDEGREGMGKEKGSGKGWYDGKNTDECLSMEKSNGC